MNWKTATLAATLAVAATAQAHAGPTVDSVKARGHLICGASQGTVGFGAPDEKGYWRGLDVETCRAVAVAVFGDKDKVEFVPLSGQQRIPALQTGEIDILPRTLTWTLQRDANGINFATPNYYEFTGFMVARSSGVTKVEEMTGASVCVQTGSTTEVVVNDVSSRLNLQLKPVVFDNVAATRQAFFSGRCDALITDASALASVRATQSKDPDGYVIFPATKYMDALTPAVRHGDDQWLDIVNWSIQALLNAEMYGITQANVDEMVVSGDPRIKRFLGVEPGNGKALGLDDKFAYNIVKQLGNYGEMFDRNVGKGSPLKIDRGPNKLFSDGGLMFPLAFQ
ncbi:MULTISPECIES: amino acid ABC transporter substrate-binding protein [unclassified Sinorhizobium]|uniref:amino acid ABC transporter substrate-binding protein n=1 Tax=unclassified Sinorhizobium TaxID=2613772 RepID=UPI0024C45C8A|nr:MULTISPECIES: amino acid ABC transporter substrate-binding protein [unclassified Sinorhizobium]MDK1374316.1 amino acid ABC transporter substrate-binding protein [Sinorhizobium sp. 6-70]MDK1479460.1 amino acid ABC transporter substrate-binding protein [Sinorhizobium sp. 6-117]